MDIRSQSALLAAIVGLALGLSMLLRASRPRVLSLYALLALSVGGFYLAQFLSGLFAEPTDFPWVARITLGAHLVLGGLVPTTALNFYLEFLQVSSKAVRTGRRLAVLSAIFGIAVGVSPLGDLPWARVALAGWVLSTLALSLSLLLARIRQTDSRIERARLSYLALGAALSVVLNASDFVVRFGVPFPTLGPIVTTMYLFFLSQTLLRLRLLDLHELLGKIASQTVLAIILALVFAVLTGWIENNPSLFLFNTAVAAFVMLILMEPLRVWVEERVVAIFFRERFELLRALEQLLVRTANVIDVSHLAAVILDALNETRRITHASVYLLAEDRPGYRLLDYRGPQPNSFVDMGAARGLLNAVSGGQKAVLLENVERRITEMRQMLAEGRRTEDLPGAKRLREELKRFNDLRSGLQQVKAGISVPLLGNDRVVGFLNLCDERVPEAYASDEIARILEIAEQLSTVIENSKLYDKMRERDRLAALGEMSAGLAHEIRNPLGAIKGAAQCLDPSKLPREESEFVEVIVEEVNRLNGVVSAFLDYARPLKQNFGPTDLNEVVSRTVRLVQTEVPANIELKLEPAENLARVDCDAEQLKQVLINLIQNAVQAIAAKPGSITLRTLRPERFSEVRGNEMVEVHVIDNGPGIPTDQQSSIFIPFFTTKQKGTGLGLAICQRIVKNHGGTISVQSKVQEGSTFVIRLPALAPEGPAETPPPEGTPLPAPTATPIVPTNKEGRKPRRERGRKRAM